MRFAYVLFVTALVALLAGATAETSEQRVFLPNGVRFEDLDTIRVVNPYGSVNVQESGKFWKASIISPEGSSASYSLNVDGSSAELNIISAFGGQETSSVFAEDVDSSSSAASSRSTASFAVTMMAPVLVALGLSVGSVSQSRTATFVAVAVSMVLAVSVVHGAPGLANVEVNVPAGTCYTVSDSGFGVTINVVACADAGAENRAFPGVGPDNKPEFGNLSIAEFDIRPVEIIQVPTTTDGERMYNAVYRPDTDEPVPVYINFSPYWGDSATANGDAFSNYLIEEFVPRGYAVVLSAVRGTGKSEGCFQIGGDIEVQDTHDMIDFFAEASWSNGKVGMGGKSYDSTTGNGVIAKNPHPALDFVFHVSGITDMWRYNYQGGLPYVIQGLAFNAYFYAQGTDEYGASLIMAGTLGDEDPESLLRILDDALCPQLPEIQIAGAVGVLTGLKTDYWVERDWTQFMADSEWEGTYFFYHGHFDYNVKPDHVLPWLNTVNQDKIDMIVWLHQDRDNIGHVYPGRADWNETFIAFMDNSLKGLDTGSDEVWRVQSQANPTREWFDSPNWGREETEFTEFSGLSNLVSTVLTSEGEGIRISGEPYVRLSVTTPNPDAVLTAILWEEDASGARNYVTEGAMKALLRDNREYISTYLPNQRIDVEVYMFACEHVLQPGSSLVLDLQSNPAEALVLPTQRLNVEIDTLGSKLFLPLRPMDDILAYQPDYDGFGITIS